MQQFLIVKTSAIGDVIQSFQVIEALKMRYPSCLIDWVVEKGIAPLVEAHPHLDRVLVIDSKKWRKNWLAHRKEVRQFRKTLRQKQYDALFDLQGNAKSGAVNVMARARKKVGYSWNSVSERPNYFSTNVHLPISTTGNVRCRYMRLVEDFLGVEQECMKAPLQLHLTREEEVHLQRFKQLGFSEPRLMICFGSNWENKRLSKETLLGFLQLLDDKLAPTFFFVFGNEEEKKIADALEREFSRSSHSIGGMSLPLWQRCMQEVNGVISVDSAALHLCGTTRTPSFSIFGPSSALAYKPLGENHRAFQGGCPYNVSFDKRCPQLRTCSTGACMKTLTAEELFDQFESFWSKVSKSSELSTI